MKGSYLFGIAIIFLSCKNEIKHSEASTENVKSKIEINSISEEGDFEIIDFGEINNILVSMKELVSPRQIMKMYYPFEVETGEGKESLDVTEEKKDDSNTQLTLVHDYLLDDSMKAKQVVMDLKKVNSKWLIIALKSNWKCWEGRGHVEWGTALCN